MLLICVLSCLQDVGFHGMDWCYWEKDTVAKFCFYFLFPFDMYRVVSHVSYVGF